MRHTIYAILAGAVLSSGTSAHAVITQQAGSEHVIFQAEAFDQILNPDAANDVRNSAPTGSPESPAQVWSVVSDTSAFGGSGILAPNSPHKQTSDPSLQESIAVYSVQFDSTGSYTLYIRGRNNGESGNGSSDSLWIQSTLGEENPSASQSLENTGSFAWKKSDSYTINSGDLSSPVEFRFGVREPEAVLDAFVLSKDSSLGSTDLDTLFGAVTPTPANTPIITPTPNPTTTTPPGDMVTNVGELNTALSNAEPGDVVVMKAGVWNDVEIIWDGRDSSNGTGGTADNPITLAAEYGGGVVISGDSNLVISGNYMVVDGLFFKDGYTTAGHVVSFRRSSSRTATNCRLTNTAIVGYNPDSESTNYKWVSIYGLNNRVDHCWFGTMRHIGVQLTIWLDADAGPNNHRIDHNYFNDRVVGSANGYETIRIGDSNTSMNDSRTIVEYNLFDQVAGDPEIISNKSVGNIYRYNTFLACEGQLTLRHGTDCYVHGNFFDGMNANRSAGVRIVGPRHRVVGNYFQNMNGTGFHAALAIMNGVPDSPLNRYLRAEDCLVAFNTFVNCVETFAIGVQSSDGDTTLVPNNNTIANNLVLSDGRAIFRHYDTPTNMTYEGNLVFGGALGFSPAPTGIATNQDPLLAIGEGGLYRPAGNSPAVDNAAGSYPDVTEDMDGQARDANKDIGADEVSTAPITIRPLAPEDVGPNWKNPQGVSSTEAWKFW